VYDNINQETWKLIRQMRLEYLTITRYREDSGERMSFVANALADLFEELERPLASRYWRTLAADAQNS
jgi:hypothetical protein